MRIDTVSAIHTSRPRVSLTRAAASQPDERSVVIRREACSQGRQTAELQSDVANLHSQLNMARQEAAVSARQGAEMHQARHSVSLESLGCSRASVAPSQDDIVVLPRAVWFSSYACDDYLLERNVGSGEAAACGVCHPETPLATQCTEPGVVLRYLCGFVSLCCICDVKVQNYFKLVTVLVLSVDAHVAGTLA